MGSQGIPLSPVEAFDPSGDHASVAQRWKSWKSAFEFYLGASGITDEKRSRCLLLHCAGRKVQEVFATLTDTGEDYETAMNKLDTHFGRQQNVPFQRDLFRKCVQEDGETISGYVTRLQKIASTCNFGANKDDFIRDQVIDTCRSRSLRIKLLSTEELTLAKTISMATAQEEAEFEANAIEKPTSSAVNWIDKDRKQRHSKSRKKDCKCDRCGKRGHEGFECKCTKDKKCRECGEIGHFAKMCTNKQPKHRSKPNYRKSKDTVRAVNDDDSSDEYTFALHPKGSTITVTIGNVPVDMMIDSGSTANIINSATAKRLQEDGCKFIKCRDRFLHPYASPPILIICKSTVIINANNKSSTAEIVVVEGNAQPLLGMKTATSLDVLKVGGTAHTYAVNTDDIIRKFEPVFQGVGKLKDFTLKLNVDKSVTPVAVPARRVPFNYREKASKKLFELMDNDIIEPVEGPTEWVSPMVIAPKSNGDVRVCIDMRLANKAIIRERHPIPTVEEILEEIRDATVFSRLDLKWGFHQIELEEESRYITTFATHEGLFRYRRLNFGISSAPETYQRIIHQVLDGLKGARNIADDIIVFGTEENHDERLHAVLQRLQEKGLTLNQSKCEFGVNKTTFMGHVLTPMGVAPGEAKKNAVINAPTPQNQAEVRSFLGLVNYMAKFVHNLATLSEPLRRLTRNNAPWVWNDEQEAAFKRLKEELTNTKLMAYFNKDAETEVMVDASPVGLGAILSQRQKNGEMRPVYYASRTLSDVERRYSQTEKEALAVVWGCERFSLYLVGKRFDLITDHKPLETIYGNARAKPLPRIERWVLRLQPFDFNIKYRKGSENAADALSRLPVHEEVKRKSMADNYCYMVINNATPAAFTTAEIEQASADDPELSALRHSIRHGLKYSCPKEYQKVFTELSTMGKIVMRGQRIVIPFAMRTRTLHLAHEGHQGIVRTKQRLRSKVWWPGMEEETEAIVKQCHVCQLVTPGEKPAPMARTPLPDGPWQDLAIDLCGPFPTGESLLCVVDYYSRWIEVKAMKKTTASSVINVLKVIFATHGIPNTITSDNGPQFIAQEYRSFLKENGIKARHVTPEWPQANGEVERQNRTILKFIRAIKASGKRWQDELWTFLLAYRTTPHAVTGVSPAELLMNRVVKTKVPQLSLPQDTDGSVRERDAQCKMEGKIYGDKVRKSEELDIKEGDFVLLKQQHTDKTTTPFEKEPYKVEEKRGNSYIISTPSRRIMRNGASMKKFHPEEKSDNDNPTPESTNVNEKNEDESPTIRRPERIRATPSYLKDFVTK